MADRPYNTTAPTGTNADDDRPSPIGVSEQFRPAIPSAINPMLEMYGSLTGDNYQSINDSWNPYRQRDQVDLPARLSDERRAELQLQMRAVGLLDPKKKLVLGRWDSASESAFEELLKEANMRGLDWEQALEHLAYESETFGTVGGSGDLPALPSVTNPNDLARGIRTTAQEVYGTGNVPKDRVQNITARFQDEERRAQGEGSTVDAQSASGFIEDELRQADPIRADARKVVMGLREVGDLLGGG